jgi:hypothetical protein
MTTQLAAIFKPLGLELTRQMEAVMGRTREDVGSVDVPPRPSGNQRSDREQAHSL